MALTLDNVGIVVEDLDAAVGFFEELGLELEGRDVVEGEWAGRVTGLGDQRVEIAMLRTPDGHGRLELSRFLEPAVVALAGSWVGLSGIVGPELGGAPTGPAGTLVSAPGIGAVVVALAV